MKRRNFVRNTALSAIGLGILPSGLFASGLGFQSASAAHWLRQLGDALAGKRQSKARFSPESIAKLVQTTQDQFAPLGYRSENDTFYFFGEKESWCFYPLVFRHTSSGATDLALPVMRRDQEGNWHLVKTLSGFQLEALSRASLALAEHTPAALQNLLFPSEIRLKNQGALAYKTQDGMVAVKTILTGGKAQTTCTVTGREGTVFSETFSSKHGLSA
ncbi:MAG: hypothetical protein ACKVT2_01420 [Saprospiraceae bacterium]